MSRSLRPLVLALAAFLLGLLPALRFAPRPLPLLIAGGALLALTALLSRDSPFAGERPFLVLLASLACAGGALGALSSRSAATDCRAQLPDGAGLRVTGRLASDLYASDAAERPLLTLNHASIRAGAGQCTGSVRVLLPDSTRPLSSGAELRLEGRWRRTSLPVNPSAWPRDPARSGYIAADSLLGTTPPTLAAAPFLLLRGRVEARLHALFPEHFALVEALLLGRRERLGHPLNQAFAAAGLAHVLSISGMHVGLLAGVLLLVGTIVGVPRERTSVAALVLLALYLTVIGAPAAALRAGIMIALAITARLLQRPSAALPILATAALVLVAADPMSILSPGFQLSFLGVAGILLFERTFPKRLLRCIRPKPLRGVAEALLVGAAAFLATAPVSAHHFGTLAPIGLSATVVAVPLLTLALVGILLALLISPLSASLAALFAAGAGVMLDALERVARWAAAVPYGHTTVVRPSWAMWTAAALVVMLGLRAARRLRLPVRAAVAGGMALTVLLAWPAVASLRRPTLEIYFLDVGQGDAIALRTPADRWVLVDAGPHTQQFDAGERRVLPFLRAHRAKRLEALILTHPDEDHIGGAAAVVRGIPVARVIEPGMPAPKPSYQELLAEIQARGVPWSAARRGRVLALDGVTLTFLWPEPAVLDRATEENEISAVVRVEFGAFSAILTGDAPADVEARLVGLDGEALRSPVLKAGHHGSATSSSELFLRTVRPRLVVISVGRHNRYGHPAPGVMRRLARLGIPIARTDREGTVEIRAPGADGSAWERVRP